MAGNFWSSQGKAQDIFVEDTGDNFTSNSVEGALAELADGTSAPPQLLRSI